MCQIYRWCQNESKFILGKLFFFLICKISVSGLNNLIVAKSELHLNFLNVFAFIGVFFFYIKNFSWLIFTFNGNVSINVETNIL